MARRPLAALLLACALTLPPSVSAGEGGLYGEPYLVAGVGGAKAWEQYRKHQLTGGDAGYPAVTASGSGQDLRFQDLRQGCEGNACAFLAPGLFVARHAARESPPWALPVFGEVSAEAIDVRLGFVEAGPDGDLRPLVAAAGGDLGAASDLYFGSFPNDFLSVHLWLSGPPASRSVEFRERTCHTAGSALLEPQRTAHSGVGPSVGLPQGQPLRWALVGSAGATEFVVWAGSTELLRWTLEGGGVDLLRRCGNPDDGAYSDGRLDLDRVVPVLFVGWATMQPLDRTATLSLGLQGYGPSFEQVPPSPVVGVDAPVRVAVRDEAGARVTAGGVALVLTATGTDLDGGVAALPTAAPGGEESVSIRFAQAGEQTVRLALQAAPEVYVERRVVVAPRPGTVDLQVGCAGCNSGGGGGSGLALVLLLGALRRAARSRR